MILRALALSCVLAAGAGPGPAQKPPADDKKAFGILLLAHGGNNVWNRNVLEVRKALLPRHPAEVAFGMADPKEIQRAADRLAAQKVRKIVAVPLFVSSHSEVIEQTKYVLGMRKDPSKEFMQAPHAHMAHTTVHRVSLKTPLVMSSALDDHPLVAEILLDRAREMARKPGEEAVVLVGHGPLRKEDDELWLRYMDRLAASVREKGGFAEARSATIRDDSPPAVKEKAEQDLRRLVRKLSLKKRVIVVPHLLSQGGIERHVRKALDGTFYDWTGKTLLPDARISQWIEAIAQGVKDLPDMRQHKDAGRPLPAPEKKKLIDVDMSKGSRPEGVRQ